jgi:CCT motif
VPAAGCRHGRCDALTAPLSSARSRRWAPSLTSPSWAATAAWSWSQRRGRRTTWAASLGRSGPPRSSSQSVSQSGQCSGRFAGQSTTNALIALLVGIAGCATSRDWQEQRCAASLTANAVCYAGSRYRQKRNERVFTRRINYQCRKTLADSRPRVRGRFARSDDAKAVMPDEAPKHALMEPATFYGGELSNGIPSL